MATEKRKIHRVVDREGTLIQVLPETSAEQVTLADAGNKFTSTNVEAALAEVMDVAKTGGVTGVKGNAESTYRKGDVNITAENVGAEPAFTKNTAFNKDFGTSAGTVMEGNDTRVTTAVSDIAAIKEKNQSQDNEISSIKTKNTEQDTAIAGKANLKGGNSFTGDQSVTGSIYATGGITVGGNLTVNGTTTTVDSTTLQVKDKLIEVAHGNTTKLTTPAGLVAPKYDGTKSGALVFDGDGIASVGDVELDATGNIDVTRSQLQPLATRTGLVNDYLVKYDSANQTLVDSGKKISDFATAAQGSNADSALAKANANATEIDNIKNGTNGTKVKNAEHADTADSATSATNVSESIKGKAISSIFESNGTTVKEATQATTAGNVSSSINGKPISDIFESDKSTVKKATRVANQLYIQGNQKDGKDNPLSLNYDGHAELSLGLYKENFTLQDNSSPNAPYSSAQLRLSYTGVAADQYSAVNVDVFGRVTAGGKSIEWGTSRETTPSGDLMVGGLFMELQE